MGFAASILAVANTLCLLCEGRSTDEGRPRVGPARFGVSGDHGLSHGSHGGGYHGRTAAGSIDLGHEPPLSVNGQDATFIDRRRVSVQWFSGTILTGLCGAALIGGAVFTALDGETTFASVPERIEGALRGAFGANEKATTRKTDRLPPPSEATAARSVIRVSQRRARRPSRHHARAPLHPHLRQSVAHDQRSLGQDPAVQRAAASDRCRFAAAGRRARNCRPPRTQRPTRKFPSSRATSPQSCRARRSPPRSRSTTSSSACATRRTGRATATPTGGVRYASAGTPSDMRLAYAAEGQADPYAGFEARVVPENVTLLGKTKEQATGGHPSQRARSRRQEGRKRRDDPARCRRIAGRDQGDRRPARRARPRRRTEGRPEAARADDAAGARPQAAGRPRRRRQRKRGGSRGRALRSRQIRQRRRCQPQHADDDGRSQQRRRR